MLFSFALLSSCAAPSAPRIFTGSRDITSTILLPVAIVGFCPAHALKSFTVQSRQLTVDGGPTLAFGSGRLLGSEIRTAFADAAAAAGVGVGAAAGVGAGEGAGVPSSRRFLRLLSAAGAALVSASSHLQSPCVSSVTDSDASEDLEPMDSENKFEYDADNSAE